MSIQAHRGRADGVCAPRLVATPGRVTEPATNGSSRTTGQERAETSKGTNAKMAAAVPTASHSTSSAVRTAVRLRRVLERDQ